MGFKFQGKNGVLMIAEIGGNHEGIFDYAKKLVNDAISTKADVVYRQLYTGDTLVNKNLDPQRNEHFKKFELTQQQHMELARMILDAGKLYTASVWDLNMMEWIDEFISFYKIGSGDLTAYPILERTARKGKPIVLSTGLSTEKEVVDCVHFIQNVDPRYKSPEYLAVLQCTAMYPIRESDANLSVIKRYKDLLSVPISYSDHKEGSKALLYSVLAGADILEFHFKDNRDGKIFRDHFVSLTPEEVDELAKRIEEVRAIMGDEIKKPMPIEIENNHVVTFRRGVYPARDISCGTLIQEEDLVCLRPDEGISANEYYSLIGKTAKIDLKQLQKLDFKMFR